MSAVIPAIYNVDMDDSQATRDLADVRRLVLAGLRGQIAKVYLFGSRAQETSHRSSDIDVAILPAHPLPLWTLSQIRSVLEESHVPYNVDLVDLSVADAAFRERVIEEGILWNGRTTN